MKEEEQLEICGGLREEVGMKNVLARPNGLRENDEKMIFSGRGPGLPVVGRRMKMYRCALVAKQ